MTRVEDIMKKKIAIVLAIITIISNSSVSSGDYPVVLLWWSNESDAYIIALTYQLSFSHLWAPGLPRHLFPYTTAYWHKKVKGRKCFTN